MNHLIVYFMCLTSAYTASKEYFLKSSEKVDKPDIEKFIDRLLTSDKFEQLADKIAERAADKIITLQQGTSKYAEKKGSLKQRSSSTIDKNETEENKSFESEKPDTKNFKKSQENKSSHEIHLEKPKIDTIAAIQKFAKFPEEELSLNYKHFTTEESLILKHVPVSTTTTKVTVTYDNDKNETQDIYQRVHSTELDIESKQKQTETSDWKNSNSGSTSDEKQESKEIKKKSEENIQKDVRKNAEGTAEFRAKKKKKHQKKKKERSTSSSSSSSSNESLTPKKKHKKKALRTRAESSETMEVEIAETTKSASRKQRVQTTPNSAESDNSSPESEENKVSNIADSAKIDEKEKDSKNNEEAVKKEKHQEAKTTASSILDLKHKVRKQNGKLFAFAQSPDYEEYHEELSKLLKSVKDKKIDRDAVNKDLLDLIE